MGQCLATFGIQETMKRAGYFAVYIVLRVLVSIIQALSIETCAGIVRLEAERKRKGVEPHDTARPGGIDPAYCCLTPHGFSLPAGIMFPVDTRDLSRAISVSS